MTREEAGRLRKAACASPIQELPLPARVTIPLCVRMGARRARVVVHVLEPVVGIGDRVKAGAVLATDGENVILASISGKVTALRKAVHPLIGEAPAAIIESDGTDSWVQLPTREGEVSGLELRALARQAGVLPSFSPPLRESSRLPLEVDAVDRDPLLATRSRLVAERGEQSLEMVACFQQCLKRNQAALIVGRGLERKLLRHLRRRGKAIGVKVRSVPADRSTSNGSGRSLWRRFRDQAAEVDTRLAIEDAHALWEALHEGHALVHEYVTVTGSGVRRPVNLKVRLGTPLREVLDACGGAKETSCRIILGDALTGIAQYSPEVPIVRGVQGMIVLGGKEAYPPRPGPCIRCTRCVEVCPEGLKPALLAALVERGSRAEARELGILDCTECGLCAYVCPAKRDLVHLVMVGKTGKN